MENVSDKYQQIMFKVMISVILALVGTYWLDRTIRGILHEETPAENM